MNLADTKRLVLIDAEKSSVRKKIDERMNANKISKDDIIDQGKALEEMTRGRGWAYVEAYILRNINLNEILADGKDADRNAARGLMGIIHYVKSMIDIKDRLLREMNEQK